MSPSSLDTEFEAKTEERLSSGPAKYLMDKLKALSSHVERYQKRWFWELLQNACDRNSDVKVQVQIDDNFLYFRHNGKPFTVSDATNLIFPDSDKDKENDINIIGQFGTGFISTHILSAKIRISGVVIGKDGDLHYRRFHLDRTSRNDKSLLAAALKESEKELRTVQAVNAVQSAYQTEYAYYRVNAYEFVNLQESFKIGVESIRHVMPFVFAFVPQLAEVEIINQEDNVEKFIRLTAGLGCSHQSGPSNVPPTTLQVVLENEANTQVAVIVKNGKVDNPERIPKLFCAYPLVGTESFPFPCVVNSPVFIPISERYGIEISKTDVTNRNIISDAVKAFAKLLDTLSKTEIGGLFRICGLFAGPFEGEIQTWYKSISDLLKNKILSSKVVLTKSGYEPLKEVLIPVALKPELLKDFLAICENTTLKIPDESELHEWVNALDFSIYQNQKLDLKELIKRLGQVKVWNELIQGDQSEQDWFVALADYVVKEDQLALFQNHPLVLVKSGHVRSLKTELFWDCEIPKKLKEIYDLLHNVPYDKMLIHEKLEYLGEKIIPLDREKTENDICDAIDAIFKKASAKDLTPTFIEALEMLLSWTDSMSIEEEADRFPHFSTNKARLTLDTLGSNQERNTAFVIIRSAKKDALAKLALSDMSSADIEKLISQQREIQTFLTWKSSVVDDKENADAELGNIGEEHIHKLLIDHFKGKPEFQVEWVAKTRKEDNYDFEIRKDDRPVIFVDAKTTGNGIANSDSIPFFMRKGQWNFLETLEDDQYYFIARVFLHNDSFSHRFLKIEIAKL